VKKLYRLSLALAVLLTSCLFDTREEKPAQPGFVSMAINLKPNANALLKIASADTLFTLDTLNLILSSTGSTTQYYSYPISGRSDTGNITVSPKIYALSALRIWQAKIVVIDTTFNSAKKDTVYLDSMSFTIKPGDTAFVIKTASPSFSILRTRLVSNSPSSLTNGVKWLRLRVDNVMMDSVPVGQNLCAVSFGNSATGSAVGDSGIILRTANSSVNWSTITSGTTQNLNGVTFPSANTGFVVGNSGTILKTTTGTAYVAQTSGTTADLNGVHFSGTGFGIAVGNAGTIKKSNGTTWSSPTTNPATQNLNAVFAASTSIAYAVGNAGTIMKTTDAGVTWTTLTSGTTQNLLGVYFTSTTAGFAVGGAGTILKTTNGTSWSLLTSGTAQNLTSVSFTSSVLGYAVGNAGTLLRTTDGTAWTKITVTTSQDLLGTGWTTNGSSGVAIGNFGTVVKSTNGTTWTHNLIGTKSFDMLLTYKYLQPNISHTLLMDAIDTLAGPLRGYQASKTVLITPGKDTTITATSSLSKCGYSGFPTCL
jgi:photosystem II stability/assembly factor-like uncharacterized protein